MSATEVNALVGLATFLVISITAIAAVVQLRHLRRANELDGLLSVLNRVEDLGFQSWVDDARRIVAEQLRSPFVGERPVFGDGGSLYYRL